jgi:hypothetical protein
LTGFVKDCRHVTITQNACCLNVSRARSAWCTKG